MTEWLQSPLAQGAMAGLLTAAAVDFQAFRAWKGFGEIVTYAWRTALFRWMQGAVVGAVTAAGLNGLTT